MRIRSLKPEFWRSDDVSALSPEDRLLFIGLWSYVDDNGVGVDRVYAITADLFAADVEKDPRETFARVSRGLQKLSDGGLIARYNVEGKSYLFVTGWAHQKIDKPNVPRLPLPDGQVRRPTVEDAQRFSTPSRHPRDTPSPGTEEQGNRGTEDKDSPAPLRGADAPASPKAPPSPKAPGAEGFEEFWQAYPRKVSKADAVKAWKVAVRKATPAAITDAVRAHASTTWAHGDAQFIPYPGKWLRAERWTDPAEAPNALRAQHGRDDRSPGQRDRDRQAALWAERSRAEMAATPPPQIGA